MGCEAGRCDKTSTIQGVCIVTPSLEEWPTKAKEVSSPHEVRLTPLDTSPVFQCLRENRNIDVTNLVHKHSRLLSKHLILDFLY